MMPRPSDPLASMTTLLADPLAPARDARAKGMPVVGTIGAGIPRELVLAAAAYPVALHARPADRERDCAPMEAWHDSEVRSLFRQAVTGEWADCDLVVISGTSDGYRYLYQYLTEVIRTGAGASVPPLFLHDFLFGASPSVTRYAVAVMATLSQRLASLTGHACDADAIGSAITRTNAVRRLLAELDEHRWTGRLSGAFAARAVAATASLLPEPGLVLLQDALSHARLRDTEARARLAVVSAVPLHPFSLFDAIEAAGATVVADSAPGGSTLDGPPVEDATDPISALCAHQRRYDTAPRQHPAVRAAWLDTIIRRGVDGVVFYLPPDDRAFGWQYPALAHAAARANVASLRVRTDVFDAGGFDRVTSDVTAFVARLEPSA